MIFTKVQYIPLFLKYLKSQTMVLKCFWSKNRYFTIFDCLLLVGAGKCHMPLFFVTWHARSSDLTPLDFFFCGHTSKIGYTNMKMLTRVCDAIYLNISCNMFLCFVAFGVL